jgi:alkanesulfonate monooxygenase SsuD/methylene tetrahydromethanopterin reductase-like flavin-dependent oxidoreductase (luciferase family)
MEPKPAQKPHPPVWFGANGEAALRRATRLGDGFFGAGSTPTATFADQVPVVRAALAAAGRDAGAFPIAKRLYIAVDDDGARARERMSAALGSLYGRRVAAIEAAAVTGRPGDCASEVAAAITAGAGLVVFTTLFDPAEQAERIAAEVIPRLG